MRAIVCDRYGPPDEVLEVAEIDQPAIGDDEVLVRVFASSVNPADWHAVRGEPYFMRLQAGLRRPRGGVIGSDLAGRVERVGRNVTTLRAGDEVFGSSFTEGLGAFADYVAVSERVLAPKPASLSFEQAAAIPMAGLTALQALRDGGRVEPGQRVLVIGASGGVGSFAVQLAKSLGAEVTGVASTPNVELVSSLGADHVIDYTRADFARGEERYDVVVHLAGIRPLADLRRVLTPRGVLLLLSGDSDNRWLGPVPGLARALARSAVVGQRYRVVMVKPNRHDLEHLAGLVEAGELSPVISRTWPLDGVAEAVRWVEAGHTRGKVAVCVSEAVSEAREAMPFGAAIGGAAC